MGKIAIIMILLYSLIGVSFTYAINYNDTIKIGNPIVENTQNNIKQARLIEKYIINYKSKVKDLQKKYDIRDSQIIKENLKELGNMVDAVRKIQTNLVEKDDAQDIIKSIVEGLRITNDNLKPYLKVKRQQYENRLLSFKLKYKVLADKMSLKIRLIIKQIAEPMKKEGRLSLTQKQVLKHLIKLEGESKKLDSFISQDFKTIEEAKTYLVEIIITIRNEISGLKELL